LGEEYKPFICSLFESRNAVAKAAFKQKEGAVVTKKLYIKFKEETSKVRHLEHSFLCGAETLTLREVDKKYLESFAVWCWRRMEISWTDHVGNEEVLRRVKEQRNILHAIKRLKAKWVGHTLRKNCLL